jgi:hypothetical protein
VADEDGGSPKFSLLWKSPKLMSETGEEVLKKKLHLAGGTTSVAEEQTSSSLQKDLTISDPTTQASSKTLNKKRFIRYFRLYFLLISLPFLLIFYWFIFYFRRF